MTAVLPSKMLIGRDFVAGAETSEEILNPRTGEVLLRLPEASIDQVEAAVAAAVTAFQSYSRLTPAARSSLLLRLADRIEAEAETFAALEALNCGKPHNAVLRDEIPGHRRLLPILRRRGARASRRRRRANTSPVTLR